MTGTADLLAELRAEGIDDVDDSVLARALYSTDASLYRVVPRAVVRPRDADEVEATVAVARRTGVPLTSRGAGTSIAGNAVGPGIVLDFARYLHRVHEIDVDSRTALVDPGVVQASLQRAAAPHGLRFGPDPSTHTRCTIGGMIGNNACGARALGYGRTADNVAALRVVTADGERLDIEAGRIDATIPESLRALVGDHLALIRTELGRFGRQVSGYSLEHLLPERGFDLPAFLAGTEGTLATTTRARVRLVRAPSVRVLLVLGYPSMPDAADDVPAVLPVGPTACEGLDSRIVDVVRAHGGRVPDLRGGAGWLFCEGAGDDPAEVAYRIERATASASTRHTRRVESAAEQAVLWRIREEGAGLATRTLPGKALSGWEDAAVPPERLGRYLRDFDGLLEQYGVGGVPYGHFGDGCVHVRIDFGLDDPGGRERFRGFLFDAADLVAAHGGSLSGEHGDGRARSELLPRMYSAEALALFARVKTVFDPDGRLNPGVLVDPAAVDADLRGPEAAADRLPRRRGLRLLHDDGDLGLAVHRCTGVGKCLADPGAGGVMCPSFQATRDEKDSTRGRARVLQEMVDGRLVGGGFAAPEVHEALDLCLSCKGCLSDCPTGVDMASYKAEVLHQTYAGRRRPRSHYALGRLPRWARLTAPLARLASLALRSPGVARLARWVAGVDQRRGLPELAPTRFARTVPRHSGPEEAPRVLVWADSFTEYFSTGPGRATVAVLRDAGYRVETLSRSACCGLTWISTGQLDRARELADATVGQLHPYVAAGIPVVGVEPSCLATLRSDVVELSGDPRATEVAAGVSTLAELLSRTPGWRPPDLTGVEVIAQPHCHHAAVMGWEPDLALLARAGAIVRRLGGCCGLAGNFGVEKGHYEVSVAVAEQQLLPAVRERAPDTVVLADGFSCRTQLDDLAGVRALHLAELLASAAGAAPDETARSLGSRGKAHQRGRAF